MDSMWYPTARSEVTADIQIKPLPADEETHDEYEPNRGPAERPAMETPAPASIMQVPSSRASSEVTVQGWKDKTPGELVSIILEMQSSHEQQVAELQSQYAVVSRQLTQLTSILNSHFVSQMAAIQTVQQDVVAISLPQQPPGATVLTTGENCVNGTIAHVPSSHPFYISSQPTAAPSTRPGLLATPRPGGGVSTSAPRLETFETRSHATPSPSQGPTATLTDDPHDKSELQITPSPVPNQPPQVIPSRLDTVVEVWEEYRYGRNGNPSVELLEARWGPRWRRDPKVQRWFGRRKIIADKIKQLVADGIDEKTAIDELVRMRRNRSLNWLSRELENHRKETKRQWKAAREAAIANKEAMLGSGAAPAAMA